MTPLAKLRAWKRQREGMRKLAEHVESNRNSFEVQDFTKRRAAILRVTRAAR